MITQEEEKKIEKAWTGVQKIAGTDPGLHTTIRKYIFQRVCGNMKLEASATALQDYNFGKAKLLELNKTFQKALSIGCGNAAKEMAMVEAGIVEHFDLFELSKERIEQGMLLAKEKNIADKITFHHGDFFKSKYNISKSYDLVFWSSSLHHMMNTKMAIMISYDILKDDGYFYMDDYVGKNRFQYSDLELFIVNAVREALPDEYFKIPNSDNQEFFRNVRRISLEKIKEIDISEAADSENIVPAIARIFPHANIIHYGGLIFHLVLRNIIVNIPENSEILDYLLKLEDDTIKHNFWHYAFCLCPKHAS